MISPPITEVYKLIAKQDYDWLDLLASGNKAPKLSNLLCK